MAMTVGTIDSDQAAPHPSQAPKGLFTNLKEGCVISFCDHKKNYV